jgi:hypothetical protein
MILIFDFFAKKIKNQNHRSLPSLLGEKLTYFFIAHLLIFIIIFGIKRIIQKTL